MPLGFDFAFVRDNERNYGPQGSIERLRQVGGVTEGLLIVEGDHFWWWVNYGAVASFFDDDPGPAVWPGVPPEWQPWENAGPHETTFTLADPTGTRTYGSWTIDFDFFEDWGDRHPAVSQYEPYEFWQDDERLTAGIAYRMYGRKRVVLPLPPDALEDINAALLGDGELSMQLTASNDLYADGNVSGDGIAPGRPLIDSIGARLVLPDPLAGIPEPSTWALLVVACVPLGLWWRRRAVTRS